MRGSVDAAVLPQAMTEFDLNPSKGLIAGSAPPGAAEEVKPPPGGKGRRGAVAPGVPKVRPGSKSKVSFELPDPLDGPMTARQWCPHMPDDVNAVKESISQLAGIAAAGSLRDLLEKNVQALQQSYRDVGDALMQPPGDIDWRKLLMPLT